MGNDLCRFRKQKAIGDLRIDTTLHGHWRSAKRSKRGAITSQEIESLEKEKVGVSIRGPRPSQYIFKVPAITRRNWASSKKADQSSGRVARCEILLPFFVL